MVFNYTKIAIQFNLKAQYLRFALIPLLALILVHVISYGKLPFESDYQFPFLGFTIILIVGLGVCETNRFNFLRLTGKLRKADYSSSKIIRLIISNLFFSSIIFVLLTAGINQILFNAVPSPTRFITYLFIVGLVTLSETLVFVIWDSLKARKQEKSTKILKSSSWVINSGTKTLNILVNQVSYFHSTNGLVQLIMLDGRRIITNFSSFNELDKQLNLDSFFKINRQFLVRIAAIEMVEKDVNRKLKVKLLPKPFLESESVVISRYKHTGFMKWLNDNPK